MPMLAYSSVSDPVYANPEQTLIRCNVVFPHLGEDAVQFTAAESDPGWEHSEEIFARCVAGDFGPIGDYEEPIVQQEPKVAVTCVARISGVSPAGIIDGAGIMGVTRISAGRYRLTHTHEQPDTKYQVIATAEDNAVRIVRGYSRTLSWCELRVTDSSGAAADAREICVQISRTA